MKFTDTEPSANAKAAAKSVAETGTKVPEKYFSPKAKIEAAAGPQEMIGPSCISAPSKPSAFNRPSASAHGYGHGSRDGQLRTSGHSGAHQLGKRK